MNRNMKLIGIALAVLLVGGTYLIGSYVARAQMGQPPAPAQSTDSMARMATALEHMAAAMDRMSAMGSGSMGMMGQNGMGSMMQDMQAMMQQMQGQMGQMMQSCQQMMPGMASPMGQPQSAAPAKKLAETDLTRTTNDANITVTATFMNPLMKPEEIAGKLVFKIALDTHSGDLTPYDLTKLAMLHTSEGLMVDKGFTWEPQSESGHHRLGLLKVDAVVDGKPVITKATQSIELHLTDIGVPMRMFKWESAFLGQSQ
jgi:hypothetical protein